MATATDTSYYDIMILGMTGMGKSTTADKLLIANPKGQNYLGEEQTDPVVDGKKIQMSDFCLWCLSEKADELERSKARVKNLVYFRSLMNPHEEINLGHDAEMKTFAITGSCELISNDTSKVRVLDVPGFFGKNDYATDLTSSTASVETERNSHRIMRNIIRIQTTMGIKFRRILYFLPVRDALNRNTNVVKMDLECMSHFFGEDILKSMAIVATVSEKLSKNVHMSDEEKFSKKDFRTTLRNFEAILKEVFPNTSIPVPPLIFLSLSETCESVLSKVKAVSVHVDAGLLLQFDENTCANCGMKVGSKGNEKLACRFGEDWSNALPYSETVCHPVFVPEHSTIKKIVNGIVYVVTFKWARGVNWRKYVDDEVCARCNASPGVRGCMKVRSEFDLGEQGKIVVDHKSEITRVVHLDEQVESTSSTVSGNTAVPSGELNQHDTSVRVEHIYVQIEPTQQPILTQNPAAQTKETDWDVKG